MNIDWYISQASFDSQALLAELTHEYLLSIIPNCIVRRKYGIPFYTYRKDLCYMNFHRRHPYIAFIQGRDMMDSSLLEKTVKSQYAKYYVHNKEDVYTSFFNDLVNEAICIQDNDSLDS